MTTILHGQSITEADHAAWLANRRNSVGASEVAAVLGLSPWKTPLQVYAEKVGLVPPDPENAAMRRGKRRERLILEDYCDEQGIEYDSLDLQVFLKHPEYPFITATLDAIRYDLAGHEDTGIPIEAKFVGRRNSAGWGEGDDEIPAHIIPQVQMQMALTGAPFCHVPGEIAGDHNLYVVPRDDEFIRIATEIICEFWDRVQRRDPPPATDVADIRILAAINPSPVGMVELDEILDGSAVEYEAISAHIKELEATKDTLKLRLVEGLGGNKIGVMSNGRRVTKSIAHVAARIQEIKAHTQTRLTFSKGAK